MRHRKKSLRQPTHALPNRVESPHPPPENLPMSLPVVGSDNSSPMESCRDSDLPQSHPESDILESRFPRKSPHGGGVENIRCDMRHAMSHITWLKTLEIVPEVRHATLARQRSRRLKH